MVPQKFREVRGYPTDFPLFIPHYRDDVLKVRRDHDISLIYPPQSLTVTLVTNHYTKTESLFELSIDETPPLFTPSKVK